MSEFERILGLGGSIIDCFRSNFQQVAPSVLSLAKEKKGNVLEEVDTFLSVLDCSSDIDDDQVMEPTPGTHTLFDFYCLNCTGRYIYTESLVHANVSSNNT